MSTVGKNQKIISYIFQIISAVILAKAAYSKFIGTEMSLAIFNALGIDDTRLIIATIEALAALLLITRHFSQYGAILSFGTMLGALIAHVTILGINVHGDGGETVALMGVVVISNIIIMWIRRREMPLIGHTIE